MRSSVAGARGAVVARLVLQLIEPRHMVTGTHTSPRNAEWVREFSAEPIGFIPLPAWVWRRVAGSS